MAKVISQEPNFFVVVSSPFNQGQEIPYKFMRKYGRDLQDMVLLKVPTGASWQVELFHCDDGRTLLKNGWKEFAKYYSIHKFYFLIFKYRGNSQFDVIIHDLSGVEVEYQDGRRSNYCFRTFGEDFEEISCQILEKQSRKTPAASKGKKPLALEDSEEDALIEISDDGDEDALIEISDDGDDDLLQPSSRKLSRKHPRLKGKKKKFQPNLTKGKGTIRDKSMFKSYEKAKAFTS